MEYFSEDVAEAERRKPRPVTANSLPYIDSKNGKPVIPIAARFKGPGPAAYTVPSTFATPFVRNKAPAWTFGSRVDIKDANIFSPGPGAFNPRATRDGHIGGPAFSLQGGFRKIRRDGKAIINGAMELDTPGPGAYSVGKALATGPVKGPAYTISGRTEPFIETSLPGPSQYSIRSTIGVPVATGKSAPCSSIAGQRPTKVTSTSPGPALYNSPMLNLRVLNSAPAYSLGVRINKETGDWNSKTPGPGSYTPTTRIKAREAPSFSFGVRHSEYEAFVITDEDLKSVLV